jgi:L-threonylcarbamoyladenylate synthase
MDWELAAKEMPDTARSLLTAFAPGPITVVVPKSDAICTAVTAGLDTVGIRIPDCPIALEMLSHAAKPIAAPSANLSGRPSCTTWQSVVEDLDGRIDAVLKESTQEAGRYGLESSVVDCCGLAPILLRPGGITLEQLQAVVPLTVLRSSKHELELVKSPGLRHPHYQPQAQVYLFKSLNELSQISKDTRGDIAVATLSDLGASHDVNRRAVLLREFRTVEDYARDFYEFLRSADRQHVDAIFLAIAPPEGIGNALRDRQYRAAETTYGMS